MRKQHPNINLDGKIPNLLALLQEVCHISIREL
nr:MAG TPA: hypothetical protein [Bacteriophage sp.]